MNASSAAPRSHGIRSLLSVVWDPHQGLWNRRLTETVRRRLGRGAVADATIGLIVAVDTILLTFLVENRRRRLDGSHRPLRPGQPVLYIDCGLHKDGAQARQMSEWFADRLDLTIVGIEASEAHMKDAEANLADVENIDYHRVAVVGPDFDGREIKLYRNSDLGAGDSLFAARGEKFESVPARRLTALLSTAGYHLRAQPVLLRMNIEGAEHFVISDLIADDAVSSIDGYYGMWDDLSKIDPEADALFRRVLKKHRIRTIPFNDRDLSPFFLRRSGDGLVARGAQAIFALRRRAIRRDIETSILIGVVRSEGQRR